jgi:hypothetical protein
MVHVSMTAPFIIFSNNIGESISFVKIIILRPKQQNLNLKLNAPCFG